MAEDSFIREVNEELRQEKAHALWRRYGALLIGAAIIVVLATAAFQGYTAWVNHKAARIGDSFLAVIDAADKAGSDEIAGKLDAVEKSGFGAYPVLAEMRKASLLVDQGNKAAAVAVLDAVAGNASAPEILKNMAAIRAAYLLVDTGSFADVEKRAKRLATDIDPMRLAARDALGLAAWKAGKTEDALYYFRKIRDDNEANGTGFSRRADMMLGLLGDQSNNQTQQTED